jgi:hypothetical protein
MVLALGLKVCPFVPIWEFFDGRWLSRLAGKRAARVGIAT